MSSDPTFKMTKNTFEILTRELAATGAIPTGNCFRRKPIPLQKQVLTRPRTVERGKWYIIFRSEIPFGNFGLPLHSGNFPVGHTKIVLPFTFQPKFPDFFVNGKHPLSLITSLAV